MTSARGSCAVTLLAGVLSAAGPLAGAPAKLALVHQRFELPGVPVQTLAVDLDRDGRRDLAVVVAATSWGEVGFEEPTQVGEGGTFVDVLTVIPAFLDRRELLVFFGRNAGGFSPDMVRFELPPTVHAIAAGPPAAPLVAWTDDGVAELVRSPQGGLELLPRIVERTIFAGSASYLPTSPLIADLDGDGDLDLFVPVAGGLAVHLSTQDGLTAAAVAVVEPLEDDPPPPAPSPSPETGPSIPEDPSESRVVSARFGSTRRQGIVAEVLLPRVIDLNGDRRPDLLFRDPSREGDGIRVRLNLGEGRFGPAFDPLPGKSSSSPPAATSSAPAPSRDVVWLGDLDGDGQAEVVTSEEIVSGKDSMRAELKEAKRPRSRLRVHALGADGLWNPTPKAELTVEGYVFEGGGDDENGDDSEGGGARFALPSGVRDLDGDGRLDLVALKLDFSLFEAMRVLATKSIKLGLDFAIYRQGEGLSFRPVPGLDLAGVMRLRLDSMSVGQLSSFAGDFDGDGRADFVQLGRGRKVTIHRGQAGATYAPAPDLAVTLEREPLDIALVAVSDLDGDGRSDLCVTQPVGGKEIGARAALDLYLSGGSR